MSRHITVLSEVHDALILKDTLNQMGVKYTEVSDDVISIQRSYHSIMIDTNTDKISCDEANASEVEEIKYQYSINFYKDQAIKEGNSVTEEVTADGETVIYIN